MRFKNFAAPAWGRFFVSPAQTAVATIGTTAALQEVDWLLVASASMLAGLLSMLTSVAGLPEVPEKPPEI